MWKIFISSFSKFSAGSNAGFYFFPSTTIDIQNKDFLELKDLWMKNKTHMETVLHNVEYEPWGQIDLSTSWSFTCRLCDFGQDTSFLTWIKYTDICISWITGVNSTILLKKTSRLFCLTVLR